MLMRISMRLSRRVITRKCNRLGTAMASSPIWFNRPISIAVASNGTFKTNRGTGDQGESSLFDGERRWKDDPVFQVLGNIDELTSLLGMCRAGCQEAGFFEIVTLLERLQCILQDLGSHMATPGNAKRRYKDRTVFPRSHAQLVNQTIDDYADRLPTLKVFILPGGTSTSALLQYSRAVCRRLERSMIPLLQHDAANHSDAMKFVNRLSDLLFLLGRHVCLSSGSTELKYIVPPVRDV